MIYQVSVVVRDVMAKIPWDKLAGALSEKLALEDIVMEKSGMMCCKFVFRDASELEALEAQIREIIADDFTNGEDHAVSIAVKPLTEDDRKKLKDDTNSLLESKKWFTEVQNQTEQQTVQQPVPQQEQKPEPQQEQKPEPQQERKPERTEAPERTVTTAPEKKKGSQGKQEPPPSLEDVADILAKAKASLLSKVRGQQHAVDELVQGIFECELFASHNEKHKGPLATFLFMGPSGVGKTMLANEFGEISGRPSLVIDMSEFSDNLANAKFNGDHGEPAMVTGFVRKNPNGILIFDEIEKAHTNTIYLFLQILDSGRLMDHQSKREVSFENTIVIMTTNIGSALYDSSENRNLANIPRSALIDALKTEKRFNSHEQELAFPASITTRMANGRIIMFNHLEPYTLMSIVRDEIQLQADLFRKSSDIEVTFDRVTLPALMMYAGGGATDARTLRGLARNSVTKEIEEVVMQARERGELSKLRKICFTVDTDDLDPDVHKLFHQMDDTQALVFTDADTGIETLFPEGTICGVYHDVPAFQKRLRGVVDYVLLDPFCGFQPGERTPSDVEDIDSDGMDMFEYLLDFYPEVPIYLLDTGAHGSVHFDTLLSRGARGILPMSDDTDTIRDMLSSFTLNALIGNSVYQLARSGKVVSFNCAQYWLDAETVEICCANLQLKTALQGQDYGAVTKRGENSAVKFDDVVGCKTAKDVLKEFCAVLDNPREGVLSGKRIPKGVLLYGPPGTGKTMLAKAMANESNAMFLPVSAPSFFGGIVGQTEGNIEEIFKKARRYAPSVIFIDEVDAIARRRTGSIGSTHNEDALNKLLAEMDGFVVDEKRPVFVLAATNYDINGDGGRVLDPAFVRRFDRKLYIPLPEEEDRKELFRRCLARHHIHFGESHETALENMASRSGGMCNADIDMLVEMYVRNLGDKEPTAANFADALDEYRFGDVRKEKPEQLRQTAYHECGHALISYLCGDMPEYLTIVSRGNFGGYMQHASSDKGTMTFSELKNHVCTSLAGRAAEIVVYGETLGMNTGASSDLRNARYVVRACLKDYAMGEALFHANIVEAGEAIMQEQFTRAKDLLTTHRAVLDALVELLLKEKCLDKKTMQDFFAAHFPAQEG